MAFQIKGTPFINDNRELINIISIGSSSGVTTFKNAVELEGGLTLSGTGGAGDFSADNITVGGDITAATGTVSAQFLVGDGAGITNVLGTGSAGPGGETTVDDNLLLTGTLEVNGATTLASATIKSGESIAFADSNGFDAIGVSSALAEDLASETRLVSEKAIKQYVDGQIQETGGSVTFAGELGEGDFDISDGKLSIVGTPNEINTQAADSGINDGTITIGLSTSVTIEEDLTVTRNAVVTGLSTFSQAVEFGSSIQFGETGQTVTSVSQSPAAGGSGLTASSTDNELPTAKLVFETIDTLESTVSGQAVLNIAGDSGSDGDGVALDGGILNVVGSANEIETVVSDDQIEVSLRNDVKVTSSLVVGEGLGAGAGDLITISATAADASPGVDIAGDLKVSGNVDSASDAKLKENIEVIPAAMEKVAALRGVSYNWISSGKASAGVVAQEVQEVMPELVTEGESHLTVQYNGLVGLLIEAVKEQQAQIDELKARLS